ncbi:MAG: PocR ligand-binding domain-containing protein [Lachnospiraceae bacterium]|nr:PocR ligand-binding domain-containing protein [Lachnospiraceae bacterium]
MELKDFMDVKLLQDIQNQFSDATGLAAIAVDNNGNYLTEGSNFTDFCMRYTRGSREGLRRCVKCDNECKGTYRCHAGLMDFSVDIVVNNEKLGAMIGGQVLPEAPDEEKFAAIARELGISEREYINAVKKVPIRPEKSIYAASKLLEFIINYVVNFEYMKNKDARRTKVMEEELGDATTMVGSIYEKTKALEKIASKQNILALNASIEAGRAGTMGAGFAVVASQMGELSKQSGVLYKDIQQLASDIYSSVQKMNESR